MRAITRRDAIKRISGIFWAIASGGCLQTLFTGCSNQDPEQNLINQIANNTKPADIKNIKFTVLYDNVPYDKSLTADWGFSCCIEGIDKTILFDAGKHDKTLMTNISKLNLNPRAINELVISHDHEDHIAGVKTFLKSNPDTNVSLIKSFRSSFKKTVKKLGASVTEIDKPVVISSNCISTGELTNFTKNEHSLAILTNAGVIIITGCAHPGVIDIVERTKLITNSEVLLLMGGFHLLQENSSSTKKIARSLKDLGVGFVAPSHCSGGEASRSFAEVFGNRYLDSGVGRIVTSNDIS
jgi:7,8-dihydropterin-6-yl-methyl-4-(beta-D-ribofuranosyl)aminobenzene 5'-phosphate synthase